jgi:hypothetical protein
MHTYENGTYNCCPDKKLERSQDKAIVFPGTALLESVQRKYLANDHLHDFLGHDFISLIF